ncbi:efflux RND transporter periplasmic adaptor subunit [Variovorax sp. RHLX14]|uniref:efflux RND transporter periplasmic adaptor subunit n=1 Tax=Variovorax sp. RHLX14 TaxID=1259731 RepID=UPI003F46D409
MSYLLARRALLGCLQTFFLIAGVNAATPVSAEFSVSATQMQALGVTLIPLEKQAPIAGMAYPAKVVVPPSGNQIVSAPFGGRIEELLVDEQQTVKAGQPLLRLSSPEFGDLQLKLLEASSKARLTGQTVARERQLFAEGIIPERRVQEATASNQEAVARLRFAEASLRLAGVDPVAIRKMGDSGSLQDGLVVRARSAGTVVELEVKTGQRVQGSDALLRLVNTQQLWLDVQVPADRQHALSSANNGALAVVGRDVKATPMSVGAVVSDNQSVTLRARVVSGANLLRPGEMVQVRVPFTPNAAGWALPLPAIARQDDKAYVFVRSEKGFVAKPVTIISSAGQSVQVTGDLRAGEQVATGSVIALKAAWLGKSGSN